ncbi:hypothetical protein Agub_g6747, partial [Astrephomene gubernaculifera]
MNTGSIRELAAATTVRHTQMDPSGPPPFTHSRLRGYASRVEGLLDPKVVLSTSVALTSAGLADPLPHTSSGSANISGAGGTATTAAAAAGGGAGANSSSPLMQQHHHQQQQLAAAAHAHFASPSSPQLGVLPTAAAPTTAAAASGPGGHLASSMLASRSPHMQMLPPSPQQTVTTAASATPPPPSPPQQQQQQQLPLPPTAAWPPSPQPASTEDLAAALSQIQNLKAEIAGVETVLGYLKGSETAATTTTMGRKAHKLPSQEQLRARADALAASKAAAAVRLNPHPHHPHHGSDAVLLMPLRASTGQGVGIGIGGAGGGGGGGNGVSPARARSAGEAGGAGGGGGASAPGVFDVLSAETKLGRTWRLPRGPQPVGRGEAVILEAALDEALPPGAITAKYGSGGAAAAAAAEAAFWGDGDVRRDFDMLVMVQREVARQVAGQCVERGRVIEKLADRQAEIFTAITAGAKSAGEAQRGMAEQLAAVTARAAEQASELASLRSELALRGAALEDVRGQLAEATTAHEHYVWDAEQEVEQLQAQADILAAEVEHLHMRLGEAVAEKDAALSRGLARLEGDLAAVTDERDDLAQRIRFLERQLHKLRTEMNACVATRAVEVQTDPVEGWEHREEEDVPDDNSDTPSLAEIRARYAAHGYGALTPEERVRLGLPAHMDTEGGREAKGRKRRRALGHFQGLISTDRPGRVRGLQWTINAISAMYYDKVHADTVSDREGNPRPRLAEFAVEWHMTRFGLRNLAELNLLDLIASVRHHYKTSVRVRWFGQFTGLVEVGDQVDTTPHLSYYLACLTHLAAPSSLTSLFPDTGGEEGGTPPVAIKAAALPEAIKTIFKYLNDPDGAAPFLSRAVEPLTDPASQLVPLDPLLALLMAEYQKRWERSGAHLRALFRAGDVDDDGLVGYDEFAAIVRQLLPGSESTASADRTIGKMYGEAMRRLAEGQVLVDVDTFLSVARSFGLDRWRVEAAPLPQSHLSLSAHPSAALLNIPGLTSAYNLSLPGLPGNATYPQQPSPSPSTTATGTGSRPTTNTTVLESSATSGSPRAGMGAGRRQQLAGTSRGVLAATASGTALGVGGAGGGGGGKGGGGGGGNTPSNLRKTESVVGLNEQDRTLLRVLDGALDALEPALEDQVEQLLERLRGAVAAAQQQQAAAAAAVAALPGLELGPSARELSAAVTEEGALISKLQSQYSHFRSVYGERTDPAAAWLAFRMLMATLAAAAQGARPRLGTAQGHRPGSGSTRNGVVVGWAGTRSALRLAVPALPFRAGSSPLAKHHSQQSGLGPLGGAGGVGAGGGGGGG